MGVRPDPLRTQPNPCRPPETHPCPVSGASGGHLGATGGSPTSGVGQAGGPAAASPKAHVLRAATKMPAGNNHVRASLFEGGWNSTLGSPQLVHGQPSDQF